MNPNEYQQAALRTEVTPLFVNDHSGVPSHSLSRLMHALMGMNTEQAELHDMLTQHALGGPLDPVNALEEAGDQLWYIALGADATDMTMEFVMVDINFDDYKVTLRETTPAYIIINGEAPTNTTISRLFRGQAGVNVAQGDFSDLYKKFFIYGKPVNREAVRQTFRRQIIFLALVLQSCGFTLEDAMKRNIAKLALRYKNKFTQEEALNRDLAGERKALEKNET